ncbi:inactive tyrosine-protein kinase PRAG1 [Betta splendens]|uniref:Inactive tyrosine-protein kinase PRAG1 n=1 Tax=Betta splendens TaxID=158456 RepID=A0A6P7MBF0_BETSP|nr:inactive tyrosine-protein kinase PRAG1 [Betta splendens]
MASGSRSAAEAQPPALPVKKHRSNSLSPCSVDADCLLLSQVGLQHQTYTPNEVFSEPTDCHADRCPIHQRYDRFQHLERFFSDGTPPPVPRKQLARTLSLPGTAAPPLSPLPPPSPLQTHPLDFDNPLYMLAPTADVDAAPSSSRPLPFSQLSFDTPDEHLPCLFRAIDDQRAVSQGIQHRHLLFLRSTVQSAEAEVLLRGEASEKDVGSYRPQDFLLCEGGEPKQMGGGVYYRLQSPRFPGRVLGLKVHKQTDGPPSAHNKHRSSHVNVQDVIADFQPSNNPRKEFLSCTSLNPPHRGSTEPPIHLTDTSLPSAQAFLLQGHSVSVERDLPHVTLEDFINGCSSLQSSECLGYDRQVCVLLVQILAGLQHLSNVSAAAAELRPRDILLVWPSGERDEGRSKMRQRASVSDAKDGMEWEKTESKGPIQMLWRTHGSPRVVLTPHSGPHFLPSVQSQIVALIQFCLHRQGGSLSKSVYRRGLVYLLSLFQGENPGPQLADMVAMLQVLLWGPHVSLFNLRGYTTTTVHNWLTIKRALLVMKLAEKGLIQDQSALGWEDFMCLQYLSFTDPETIVSVTSQLWLNV